MGAGDRLRDVDTRLPAAIRLGAGHGPAGARWWVGVALASVTVVLVAATWAVNRDPSGAPGSPDLVRVGVVQGQSVAGYVRASHDELAGLIAASPPPAATGGTFALVSFADYVAPERLASLLDGVSVAQVYARAPVSGAQTPAVRIPVLRVPDDVVAGLLDAARRRDRERGEFAQLAVALSGQDEGERRLRGAYENAAQTAAAEAAAYRSGCACVFAAVVHATPVALGRIADHTEVRVVDPAPEVRRLDRVEFRPPLPEQQSVGPQPSGPAGWSIPGASSSARVMPPQVAAGPTPVPLPLGSATVTSGSSGVPDVSARPSVGRPRGGSAVPSGLPASKSTGASAESSGASRGASGR